MTIRYIWKHLLLFVILIGSDILIGFFGHYQGSGGGDFIEYITTITFADIGPVIAVALMVVLVVEVLWKH